jgi:hypothetical protein
MLSSPAPHAAENTSIGSYSRLSELVSPSLCVRAHTDPRLQCVPERRRTYGIHHACFRPSYSAQRTHKRTQPAYELYFPPDLARESNEHRSTSRCGQLGGISCTWCGRLIAGKSSTPEICRSNAASGRSARRKGARSGRGEPPPCSECNSDGHAPHGRQRLQCFRKSRSDVRDQILERRRLLRLAERHARKHAGSLPVFGPLQVLLLWRSCADPVAHSVARTGGDPYGGVRYR